MHERPTSQRLGRPRDPAKIEAVLDASWRLFLARGVDAVTVDHIAAEAGVSKGTVYANYTDKHALFEEGVRREMVKIEAAQALPNMQAGGVTLEEVLVAFGIGLMDFLTSPPAIDFYATLAGELRRNPELAKLFYDAGPGKTHANLTAILSSPLASSLNINRPTEAAEILFGMWQGISNYKLAMGLEYAGLTKETHFRVAECVKRFLRAYSN